MSKKNSSKKMFSQKTVAMIVSMGYTRRLQEYSKLEKKFPKKTFPPKTFSKIVSIKVLRKDFRNQNSKTKNICSKESHFH